MKYSFEEFINNIQSIAEANMDESTYQAPVVMVSSKVEHDKVVEAVNACTISITAIIEYKKGTHPHDKS